MKFRTCRVVSAGPGDGGTYIRLTAQDSREPEFPEFSERWFKAIQGADKEMLAVALCAISTGFLVDAYLPEPPTQYTIVERLYVKRN